MLDNLKGDNVITKGGIYGKIINISGENLVIDAGNNTKINILKSVTSLKIKVYHEDSIFGNPNFTSDSLDYLIDNGVDINLVIAIKIKERPRSES